eukprot:MONOS_10430.1-p1 / transcript=MONOS_10430.1 / gene=MONOS_10430 / organism=Monocercomonoides_exilis_PA203 / gene_product=Peptide:N-glycanase (Png1) / transcript_product=Peptide:N-glycanase (Png1) / location=Mono_scaffold00474:46088-47833(-) / protein_length=582 / sequence_SO=supercontig / SO=protein_coding / is_pseudo=false
MQRRRYKSHAVKKRIEDVQTNSKEQKASSSSVTKKSSIAKSESSSKNEDIKGEPNPITDILRSKYQNVTPKYNSTPSPSQSSKKPVKTKSEIEKSIERQKRFARETQKRLDEQNKKRISEQYPNGIKLNSIKKTPAAEKSEMPAAPPVANAHLNWALDYSNKESSKNQERAPVTRSPAANSSSTTNITQQPSNPSNSQQMPQMDSSASHAQPSAQLSPIFTNKQYVSSTSSEIQHLYQLVQLHEFPEAQSSARALAIEILPELTSLGIDSMVPPSKPPPFNVLPKLCSAFKNFFTFVKFNSIECERCGSSAISKGYRSTDGTETDPQDMCSKVETFYCPVCTHSTLFFRYNNPIKLLETRKGRCGEFANVFTLLCRSLGFHTRIVVDVSPEKGDHVWTEVYDEHGEYQEDSDEAASSSTQPSSSSSSNEKNNTSPFSNKPRYICFDSCEGLTNRPLLYETGWGKQVTRVIGVSIEGIYDVTQRYTTKDAIPLPTSSSDSNSSGSFVGIPSISVSWMANLLSELNRNILSMLPVERRVQIVKRRADEAKEMAQTHQIVNDKITKETSTAFHEEELQERKSGA